MSDLGFTELLQKLADDECAEQEHESRSRPGNTRKLPRKFSDPEVRDLAQDSGVDLKKIPKSEFRRGLVVEREHADVLKGSTESLARIAAAHLRELPDYYTRLRKMESGRSRAPGKSAEAPLPRHEARFQKAKAGFEEARAHYENGTRAALVEHNLKTVDPRTNGARRALTEHMEFDDSMRELTPQTPKAIRAFQDGFQTRAAQLAAEQAAADAEQRRGEDLGKAASTVSILDFLKSADSSTAQVTAPGTQVPMASQARKATALRPGVYIAEKPGPSAAGVPVPKLAGIRRS